MCAYSVHVCRCWYALKVNKWKLKNNLWLWRGDMEAIHGDKTNSVFFLVFFNCCLLFVRLFSTWQMQAPSGTECCTTGNRHGSDSKPEQCKVVHVHWYTKSEMTISSSCTALCLKGALHGSTCTLIYWEWDNNKDESCSVLSQVSS